MLSNQAASIARNGIMFATTSDTSRPFPSLTPSADEFGTIGAHEHLSYSFPVDEFPGWMLVASDPTRLAYYDDDAEAMDVSNWDVIVGAVGDYACEVNYGGSDPAYSWNHNVADAYEFGAFLVDRVLLVAPIVGANGTCGSWAPIVDEDDSPLTCTLAHEHEGDHENHESEDERGEVISWQDTSEWRDHVARVERLVELSDTLADYPILDDDDYSRRECEAWDSWAESGGLRYDTTRELADAGVDESVIDAIDDSWSDVWPIAMQYTHSTNGFTGECSPDFSECIVEALARGTVRALVGASTLAY